jgi:hypothetical protein
MTSNDFGADVEALFVSRCTRYGFQVRQPEARGPCDFIIGLPGEELRVQVKGTRAIRRRKGDTLARIPVRRNRWGRKDGDYYGNCDVDFIAAYVQPWDQWYFFQPPLSGSQKVELRRTPKGKMRDAVNNWGLLAQSMI